MRIAVTELGNLSAMGVVGSGGGKESGRHLTIKDRMGMVSVIAESQSINKNSLIHTNFWHWLVDRGVLKAK